MVDGTLGTNQSRYLGGIWRFIRVVLHSFDCGHLGEDEKTEAICEVGVTIVQLINGDGDENEICRQRTGLFLVT